MADKILYALHAHGYPAPMAVLCGEHLGLYIDEDVSNQWSTRAWLLYVVDDPDKSCKTCSRNRPILSAKVLEESVDRNARAYGWEIGAGRMLAERIEASPANPFCDENWRDRING